MIQIKIWDDGGKVVNIHELTLGKACTRMKRAVKLKYGISI